ncbi:uncharacterized protein Z520_12030 [Fonsecaea multimorphosa CBS 102226]|uniref:CENP-V/GFA domain-containing protein n=1 Tax=Fonsecaea multimorphosa CBS 102226 TaxID=1442371 RepID=A0A0D2JP86_9EURO|nr:uncharacterized protein Z520_12030 [Fonsecaea multimorphosa CBS 102226]KIX92284.1 hypothetical protein Z520_12030 [Fonsecaea multimorphosa CBS 102226]OAL17655.1 hypothetical protein AYO22_11445 [Fonsecaea multimorphosa]
MSTIRPLQGACNCGRNHYYITAPPNATEQALVYFDESSASRRSQATPLTAWLRVPLSWYSSTTQSFFPDETHASIRRIFTPLHTPHSQRVFCGYCGTHLSFWTEQPPEEAEYMNITLGSLLSEDLRALQDLELLPEDVEAGELADDAQQFTMSGALQQGDEDAAQGRATQQENQPVIRTGRDGRTGGLTWFEEMLEGSRLGRAQNTRRGVGISNDGLTRVEWEVSEYVDNGSEESVQTATGSKRKIGDVGKDDDTTMQQ